MNSLRRSVKLIGESLHTGMSCFAPKHSNVLICVALLTWFGVITGHAFGQQEYEHSRVARFLDHRLDVSLLKQVETHALPPVIVDGSPRFTDLPSYYWAENKRLRKRLELARHHYELSSIEPYHALTFVAGSAGVGKTFIKREIYSKDYPATAICKFDVKELFTQWQKKGLVEQRADLNSGELVLSSLPAIKPGHPQLMRKYLESHSASFYVIDSLDEVHPDDYVSLLKQIEQFVSDSDRPFLHVVVLGRPLAFRDYWRGEGTAESGEPIELFMLRPPRFLTTGDLLVSSWNYHIWRFKLRWQENDGEAQTMPLDDYGRWVKAGFPDSISGRKVLFEPNENMNPVVQETVRTWAEQSPVVNSMLANLAGNGMIREIAETFAYEKRPYTERDVMEAFLEKWLERDSHCENRPSCSNPKHLELYQQLIEAVAAKYLRADEVDDSGHFTVEDDDSLVIDYQERTLQFPVRCILDRSGLIHFDPRKPGATEYRFEPIWLHRLLVQKYNDRIRSNNHQLINAQTR